MLPVAPALFGQVLQGDMGALALILIFVGYVVGTLWALKIRDPSVNDMKYD